MDKMSFGANGISWIRFDHLGQSYVIKAKLSKVDNLVYLDARFFYEYEECDIYNNISIESREIKKVKITHRIDPDNISLTGNVTAGLIRIVDKIELMLGITLSKGFRDIALKEFGDKSYSNFLVDNISPY